jgi:predicted ribosomally synthesized peptide with SipW-like signal peptide
MTKRLWLILAGMVVLMLLVSTSTTGALWHDQTTIDAGSVTSGSLTLLVGGQDETYVFTSLTASNLIPGQSVRAPLSISNGGSTDMTYGLTAVTTAATGPADQALAASLRLTVTDDAACEAPQTQVAGLPFKAPLDVTATFSGRDLAPLAFETLCIEVELDANAPISAASGSTSATFTFRGDQKL